MLDVRGVPQLKLRVKVGLDVLDRPMTYKQALRWGKANIPRDLAAAGFTTQVFRSDAQLHGSEFYRVSYGK